MTQIYAFEGVDGVGKSTLIEEVKKQLQSENYVVEVLKFPMADTWLGESCYDITNKSLTNSENPYVRAMFFLLNQDEGLPVIRNALDEDKIILLDRWSMSTMAYEAAHVLLEGKRLGDMVTEEEVIENAIEVIQWIMDTKYDRLWHPIPFTFYCEAFGTVSDVLDDASTDSSYDRNIDFQREVYRAYMLAQEVLRSNGISDEEGDGTKLCMVNGVETDDEGNISFSSGEKITRRPVKGLADEVVSVIKAIETNN